MPHTLPRHRHSWRNVPSRYQCTVVCAPCRLCRRWSSSWGPSSQPCWSLLCAIDAHWWRVPLPAQEVEQQLGPLSAAATLAEEPAVVVVISGPSGVGKDAVIARLRERRPELHFVVTATSR